MPTICGAAAFAAVAAYCVWRARAEARRRRQRLLRRRVAYMLWVMASLDDPDGTWRVCWGSCDH